MVSRRDRRHSHAEPQGRNLSAVQEVSAEKADRHEGVIEIDEAAGSDLGGLVVLGEGGGNSESDHAGGHAGTANDKNEAATETLDAEEG